MRIMVMGGTGQVGSRIVAALVERGHETCVLSRGKDPRKLPLPPHVRLIACDKNNREDLARVACSFKAQVVIDTVPSPVSLNHIFSLCGPSIQHYIHCSSTGVYAPLQYVPGDEDHPWTPKPGDFFEACARRDLAALALHRDKGFPVTILRPTMIIGPGTPPVDSLGGRDIGFLRDLQAHKPIPAPDMGQVLVQAGHPDDLALAFALAVDHPQRAIGRVYNISASRAITLERYLETCREFLHSRSQIIYQPLEQLIAAHQGDPRLDPYWLGFLCRHMCFDLTRARQELGYEPRWSVPAALADNIRWLTLQGQLG